MQPEPAEAAAPAGTDGSKSFKGILKKLDDELVGYEARTRHHLEEQEIGCGELDEKPSGADTAYVSDMDAAFNQAMADAQLAAQTNGTSGSIKEMNTLEQLAARHEKRVTALNKSADDFMTALKAGTVRLDPDCLKSRSAAELVEFYMFLDPAARALYPELKSVGPHASLDMPAYAAMGDRTLDLSQAEAPCLHVIACYSICASQNWAPCLSCIVQHSAMLVSYYVNSFLPCWNTLKGKPWWAPAWAWRSGCALALIVQVA